jgi:hypothetical protein
MGASEREDGENLIKIPSDAAEEQVCGESTKTSKTIEANSNLDRISGHPFKIACIVGMPVACIVSIACLSLIERERGALGRTGDCRTNR